jgi:sugar phosphate isomerase/epimerase
MLPRMEFGISTQFHRKQQVTVDMLESLRKSGYKHIELFCNRPHLDFHDRNLLRAIGRWFEENEMPPPSIHLPFLDGAGSDRRWISALEPERRDRAAAIDQIKRSLELADRVSPEYVVMHLGNPGQAFNPVMFEYAYAAIFQIRQFSGVRVMLENIPNEISTIERMQELKTVSELSDVGICYDSGHGHLQGVTGNLDFVDATHIHDNHGETDDHLWPFDGEIDWPAFIEQLVVAKYAGHFMFEARGQDGDDLSKGHDVQSRLRDMWDEANGSIEEFRLRHRLATKDIGER